MCRDCGFTEGLSQSCSYNYLPLSLALPLPFNNSSARFFCNNSSATILLPPATQQEIDSDQKGDEFFKQIAPVLHETMVATIPLLPKLPHGSRRLQEHMKGISSAIARDKVQVARPTSNNCICEAIIWKRAKWIWFNLGEQSTATILLKMDHTCLAIIVKSCILWHVPRMEPTLPAIIAKVHSSATILLQQFFCNNSSSASHPARWVKCHLMDPTWVMQLATHWEARRKPWAKNKHMWRHVLGARNHCSSMLLFP